MNEKGKVDVAALLFAIASTAACIFLSFQVASFYYRYQSESTQGQAQKEIAAQDKALQLEPSFAEKLEGIFRPQVVAKRLEQRRLEAERQKLTAKRNGFKIEINNLVADMNTATEGLAAAINKYNDTDSKEVKREALSEEAGCLEAHNRLKNQYLEAVARFVQTLPQDRRQADRAELLKLQASSASAHKYINASNDGVAMYVSGKPDDPHMLNLAFRAHNQAISALVEVQQAYNSLRWQMETDKS